MHVPSNDKTALDVNIFTGFLSMKYELCQLANFVLMIFISDCLESLFDPI